MFGSRFLASESCGGRLRPFSCAHIYCVLKSHGAPAPRSSLCSHLSEHNPLQLLLSAHTCRQGKDTCRSVCLCIQEACGFRVMSSLTRDAPRPLVDDLRAFECVALSLRD